MDSNIESARMVISADTDFQALKCFSPDFCPAVYFSQVMEKMVNVLFPAIN
jgi:hypothetical protein